LVSGTK